MGFGVDPNNCGARFGLEAFGESGRAKLKPNARLLLLHRRSTAWYYGVVPCVASLVRGAAITT